MHLKIPKSKYLLSFLLLILILAGVLIVLGHNGFAQKIIILDFFLFLISLIIYISEIKKDEA